MNFIVIEENISDVVKFYYKLQRKSENMSSIMKPISETMLHMIEDTFKVEGPGWPKLKTSTEIQRGKVGKWPGDILQVSRRLLNSLTPDYDRISAWVGTNVIYAAVHNFGGKAGRNKSVTISQREFMTFTEKGLQEIDKTILNYFLK